MENGLLVIAITGVSSVENLTAHRTASTDPHVLSPGNLITLLESKLEKKFFFLDEI